MAGEVEKINVRSPYYLTVDSSDVPTETEAITESLGCGQQINVGEDVGTRIYEVDVTNRSGAFRINYTIYRPIKITYQLTEDASPTVVGYRGGDDYEGDLLALGVDSSELTNLASGEFDNSYIEITRTSDEASTLTITVEAPLESDDYTLLMQCPDETTIETPEVGTPSDYELDANTYTMLMNFTLGYSDSPSTTSMNIYINGVLIDTLSPAVLNWTVGQRRRIVFSIEDGYNYAGGGSVITVPNSEFINNKYNDVHFSFSTGTTNNSVNTGQINVELTGLFQNPSSGNLEWADPTKYITYNYYGYGSLSAVQAVGRPVPVVGGQSIYKSLNFSSQTQQGFTFHPDFTTTQIQVSILSSYEKIINNETVRRLDMYAGLSYYSLG